MFSKKLSILDDDSKLPSKRKPPAINSAHAKQTMPKKYKNYLSDFHKLSITAPGKYNINYYDKNRATPISPSLISLVSDDSKTIASIASNNTLNLGSTQGSIIKDKKR